MKGGNKKRYTQLKECALYSKYVLLCYCLLDKLEFDCEMVNAFYSCDSFSTDRFYQKHPNNAKHTIPMKQRQDHKQKT